MCITRSTNSCFDKGMLRLMIRTRLPQAQKLEAHRRAERHALQQQENRHRVPPGNGAASPAPDAVKPRLPLADAWGNVSPPPKQPRGAQLVRHSAAGSCRTSTRRGNIWHISAPPHSNCFHLLSAMPAVVHYVLNLMQPEHRELTPHSCRGSRPQKTTRAQLRNVVGLRPYDRNSRCLPLRASVGGEREASHDPP